MGYSIHCKKEQTWNIIKWCSTEYAFNDYIYGGLWSFYIFLVWVISYVTLYIQLIINSYQEGEAGVRAIILVQIAMVMAIPVWAFQARGYKISFFKKESSYILVAVGSSGILKGKQKLGVTFNSDKLGSIDFTKFSKLTVCSA